MSNDVIPKEILGLAGMVDTIAATAEAVDSGQKDFIRFTKYGEWLLENEDVSDDEAGLWVVDPATLRTGWVAWGTAAQGTEGEMLGKHMVPAHSLPPLEADLEEVPGKWSRAVGMTMACIEGDFKGVQAIFETNSAGGRNAYAAIARAIVEKIRDRDTECVPVVRLDSDSYMHKKYGKIFTPLMEIVGWEAMGTAAEKDEPEKAEPKKIEKKPKKRKRAA